ncbi:MAG: hypothetical protein LBE17_10960 [Treponema sp.]|jgi:hypothetical protein|nr:hypothetical protein [Treponema sp.]
MVRSACCIAFILLAPFFAGAEEGETPVTEAADFFPVLSVYEAALSGEVFWRPDWPPAIPPDAFSLPHRLGGSALTLIRDREDPAEGPAAELTVRRNGEGFLSEFPLLRDGVFFQVQARFVRNGRIRDFTITPETPASQTSWDILVIGYKIDGQDSFPSLIRIRRGENVYFTMIEYEAAGATEIWYDRDGNALVVFAYRYEAPGGRISRFLRRDLSSGEEFTEAYHYDSMGNISGIVTSAGEYSALYVEKGRPRYWERLQRDFPLDAEAPQPTGFGRFTFQWDEEGLLIRFSGNCQVEDRAGQVPGGGAGSKDTTETDVRYEYIRYEYIRDERGAWTERRDTPMIRRSGFLIPGPMKRLLRRIEYPAP